MVQPGHEGTGVLRSVAAATSASRAVLTSIAARYRSESTGEATKPDGIVRVMSADATAAESTAPVAETAADASAADAPKQSPFASPAPPMGSPLRGSDAPAPIISVTPAAHTYLIDVRDSEEDGAQLGIRLEITGAQGGDYVYDLSLAKVTAAAFTDEVRTHDGLKVIVPASDIDRLTGAELDLVDGGLVLRNPNKPKTLSLEGLVSDDEISAQIEVMLRDEVNPALAAHGGFVSYVGHDDEMAAYLSMGGGCQGCAMSRMTMIEGVQKQLVAAIPSVTKVVDVTDHSSGANPYYAN
jgi:Fe/S biogenesis protein NfuA